MSTSLTADNTTAFEPAVRGRERVGVPLTHWS
jgi:hypothetical protein